MTVKEMKELLLELDDSAVLLFVSKVDEKMYSVDNIGHGYAIANDEATAYYLYSEEIVRGTIDDENFEYND